MAKNQSGWHRIDIREFIVMKLEVIVYDANVTLLIERNCQISYGELLAKFFNEKQI
jgi:hypothetical protein